MFSSICVHFIRMNLFHHIYFKMRTFGCIISFILDGLNYAAEAFQSRFRFNLLAPYSKINIYKFTGFVGI